MKGNFIYLNQTGMPMDSPLLKVVQEYHKDKISQKSDTIFKDISLTGTFNKKPGFYNLGDKSFVIHKNKNIHKNKLKITLDSSRLIGTNVKETSYSKFEEQEIKLKKIIKSNLQIL